MAPSSRQTTFPLLGLQPALGRFFRADEDRVPDRDRVVVLGYDFWRSWFDTAPTALGSTMTINGVAFTIVGVAPPRPVAMTPLPVDLYIPTMMLRAGYRWCNDALAADCTTLSMIGRLAPGRTLSDAAAEFPTIMPPAWLHAPIGRNSGVAVRQPRGMSEDDQEPRLVAVLAAVAAVLLIVCCANLAGLLSAQTAAREPEFGIRVSLGAGAVRIIRQVLTESLLLSLIGGVGGLVLSRVFIAALARMLFSMDDEGHPLDYDFSQSSAIILATMVAAVIAGVLFSVVPAIRAVRRPSGRPASLRSTSVRWCHGPMAACRAGRNCRCDDRHGGAPCGERARGADRSQLRDVACCADARAATPGEVHAERAQRFQRQVIQQLRGRPSVESVTMVGIGSILGGGAANAALPGWSDGQHVVVGYNEIGPAYFATLQTPIVLGREFDDRDTTQSPPVAIVNETLARRLWPEGRWIGSTVIIDHTPREVVGVVAAVSIKSRNEPAEPWIFAPYWQNPSQIDSRIAVRTAGDPAALLPELTREVHRVDPRCADCRDNHAARSDSRPHTAGSRRGALRRLRGLARDAADGDWFVRRACIRGGPTDEGDWHSDRARRRACAARRRDRSRGLRRRCPRSRNRRPAGDRDLARRLASPVRVAGSRLAVLHRRRLRCDVRGPWGVAAAGASSRRRRSNRRASPGVIGSITDFRHIRLPATHDQMAYH